MINVAIDFKFVMNNADVNQIFRRWETEDAYDNFGAYNPNFLSAG